MSENLTPERYRCIDDGKCPSVHRLDDGRLLIVGESPTATGGIAYAAVSELYNNGSIGGNETAIVIDPGLLEEFLRCQASDTAAVEDGVAASAALHPGSGDGAKEGSVCPWCAEGFPVISVNYGPGHEICETIYFCNQPKSQIEEPALAGDEVSAASNSASLTPPNQDFEAKARKIVRTCLNSSQAFRDAWNEGDVDLLDIISTALLTASKDATERAARIAEEMGGPFIESDAVGDGYREARTAIASAIRTQES